MTGRHEFIPTLIASQTDCEEVSNYDHASQLKAHHEAAIADWDKPAGLHKLEKPTPHPSMAIRHLAHTAVASFKIPRFKH